MNLSKLVKSLTLTAGIIIVSETALFSPENKALAQVGSASFVQLFEADGDPGQCNALASGVIVTPFGIWSNPVRIDTDGRSGGCRQAFTVSDPQNTLAGLNLFVDFRPDGDPGQCGNPGLRGIPVIPLDVAFYGPLYKTILQSIAYRIDTDNRSGGCQQTFSLSGRNDIVLDVSFTPDGDAGQCGNAGAFTVTPSSPVTFRIDTDNRSGGCRQSFRLRRV
ncbi:MAG: hypothetical protein ACSI46_17095 [Gloeotrichia echinulata DVL01]|jgi:hypothetical protein|nr:hypothetical protein [Gloeotrichia echinulata DEX184]